jgi:hypothetical protein
LEGRYPWRAVIPPRPVITSTSTTTDSGDQRGLREAGEVLQRLLRAGLSRYEPDPLGALERAEAEKKRKRQADAV